MNTQSLFRELLVCCLIFVSSQLALVVEAKADDFGKGENQFTIEFVTISGTTNPTIGIPAGDGFTFTGVNNDYRMGVCEIANSQWDKFKASLAVSVTGTPSSAYDEKPYGWHPSSGTNMPANFVSWYETAQFVNWLNTSTGHHAAYRFTGTQGTGGYTLDTWSAAEADGGTNLYRHKDAFYYIPTEDEWVKVAYWNGASLQTYANASPNDLVGGVPDPTKWNYDDDEAWTVGSGWEELNGTFNMMGNVWEWMESPVTSGDYGPDSNRGFRGGTAAAATSLKYDFLSSSYRIDFGPPADTELINFGFRVASDSLEDVMSVEIDVRPGSDRNPINPNSRGVIRVAILSTDTFDATTVDPETIELSGAKVAVRGNGKRVLADEKDVDGDGDIDLLVKIETQELDIEPGATTVTLTGETFDGTKIVGTDDIALAGDLDGDGSVGLVDLNIVLTQWGKTGRQIKDLRADVDLSGDVGLEDLNAVLIDWGK